MELVFGTGNTEVGLHFDFDGDGDSTETVLAATLSVTEDILGNRNFVVTQNSFVHPHNRVLVETAFTRSKAFGFDGSETSTAGKLGYTYDLATTHLETRDLDGDGQMDGVKELEVEMFRLFGFTEAAAQFDFDGDGRTDDTELAGTLTRVDDPFGTTTYSFAHTIYRTDLKNRALADILTTRSVSESFDLSRTVSSQILDYGYDSLNFLSSAVELEPTQIRTDDAFGNVTLTTTASDYTIIKSRALVDFSQTHSLTQGFDSSETIADSSLRYQYDPATTHLTSVIEPAAASSVTTDSFGKASDNRRCR
jgi:hypothetical protein